MLVVISATFVTKAENRKLLQSDAVKYDVGGKSISTRESKLAVAAVNNNLPTTINSKQVAVHDHQQADKDENTDTGKTSGSPHGPKRSDRPVG